MIEVDLDPSYEIIDVSTTVLHSATNIFKVLVIFFLSVGSAHQAREEILGDPAAVGDPTVQLIEFEC